MTITIRRDAEIYDTEVRLVPRSLALLVRPVP